MATHTKILSKADIKEFELPPIFNFEERRKFFNLPQWADGFVEELRTPTNKVGFILQLGYFSAVNRFFVSNKFYSRDVEYICKRYEIMIEQVNLTTYVRGNFDRHQRIILERLGFKKFDDQCQDLLKNEAVLLCANQTRPRVMFMSLVDFLISKRIEIPTYYSIADVITEALKQFERSLVASIQKHLSADERRLLDDLLEIGKPTGVGEMKESLSHIYRITLLKRSNQSTKPGKIKENIKDRECLKELFDKSEHIAEQLNLSAGAIRYYANLAIKSQVFQISRREESRYLLLIAFVIHQYYRLNDTLVDVLIQSSQTTKNSALRNAKDKLYEARQSRHQLLDEVSKAMSDQLTVLEQIEIVIGGDLTDSQKVEAVKKLLSATPSPSLVKTRKNLAMLQKESTRIIKDDDYYDEVETQSLKLQNRASEIVKCIEFEGISNPRLLEAITHYKLKTDSLGGHPPIDFLDDPEQAVVFDDAGKLRVSLYKALLFEKVADAVKSGALNLRHSYKYRSFDEYLIDRRTWESNKPELLDRAGLAGFKDFNRIQSGLERALEEQYRITNENINTGKNEHARFDIRGNLIVSTPKVEKEPVGFVSDLFPRNRLVSLYEVLSTVNKVTNFTDSFEHWQIKYNRQKPHEKIFFAGAIAYGCNLGVGKISKISSNINQNELENTVNWYFSSENLSDANDRILQLSDRLDLSTVYNRPDNLSHTSSDGKKFNIGVESLDASRSYKYFGQGMGVSTYTFTDHRHLLFHSTVITPSEREAAYVIDGLMHNDVVQSDIHSTDTHGYSEIIFGVTHLLGISFAPRIKNFKKQNIYSLDKWPDYKALGYRILPDGKIDMDLIAQHWDDILRFIVTIKLKHVTASQLFRRLSSYSRQHSLYKALKQFGRIIKSLFLLRYIDDLELRQAIEKQLNKIESVHRFEDAVYYAKNQEFQQNTRDEQLITENCKRLIENAIICWNYLYLSQLICDTEKEADRKVLIETIRSGSVVIWQHINLQGEYDFSEKTLENRFEFNLSKLLDLEIAQGEEATR
jgi:TnpA family transposase